MSLDNIFVKYNNNQISLFELSNIICVGDTIYNIPPDISIINLFIKKSRICTNNKSLSYSLYKNNIVRIFGNRG
jgi:hypothetical protein